MSIKDSGNTDDERVGPVSPNALSQPFHYTQWGEQGIPPAGVFQMRGA